MNRSLVLFASFTFVIGGVATSSAEIAKRHKTQWIQSNNQSGWSQHGTAGQSALSNEKTAAAEKWSNVGYPQKTDHVGFFNQSGWQGMPNFGATEKPIAKAPEPAPKPQVVAVPKPAPAPEPVKSQEDVLKENLAGAMVTKTSNNELKIDFKEKFLFKTSSDEIVSYAQDEINKLAKILDQYPDAKVRVEGHTDSLGASAFNQNLSQRRAAAVLEKLKTHGISAGRVTAVGYGEANPIAPNNTPQGRQENRRVELYLVQ